MPIFNLLNDAMDAASHYREICITWHGIASNRVFTLTLYVIHSHEWFYSPPVWTQHIALYVGINQSFITHLQLVQNAAAHLVTNTSSCEHITPALNSHHLNPVRFRIDFKLREHNRALRSSNQLMLEVPRSWCKLWGDCACAVAAPSLWNKLPLTYHWPSIFKSKHKTYVF